MKRYLLKRLIMGILTILIVFTLNFVIIHLAPGDPIKTLMGRERDDPEMRMALEEKFGLNKPLHEQYFRYLQTALSGDLGTSILYDRPVVDMVAEKLLPTVALVLSSGILALIIGTMLGIYAARKEGTIPDILLSGLNYVLNSIPTFWLGLMLIIIFASVLKLLPSYGMTDVRAKYEGVAYALDVFKHMILPVCTMVLVMIPMYFRIAKTSILQVSSEDYIVTLRAAGLSEKKIFNKYIFKNAILPTITLFGMSMAFLITGGTLVEIVFAWPGTGRLVLTAINQRDYPTLMGIYLIIAIFISVVMFITDIVYAVFDPRIRYE